MYQAETDLIYEHWIREMRFRRLKWTFSNHEVNE